MLKQITEESMEWQAAQGLCQEHDLGATKKEDIPSQLQQAVQLAQLPMDPPTAFGDTGRHNVPPAWAGSWCTMQNSRHGCAGKPPLKWTDVVHLVLKADERMGNSQLNYQIGNYHLQREIPSVELCCFHLASASSLGQCTTCILCLAKQTWSI